MNLRAMPVKMIAGVALLCEIGMAQDSVKGMQANAPTNIPKAPPIEEIIRQVNQTQVNRRIPSTYQVIRQYRLTGASHNSVEARVVAGLDFAPGNNTYTIQEREGSRRGTEVVRRVLEHELQTSPQSKEKTNESLTANNYDFRYSGESSVDGHPCYVLGLNPKRKQKDLISGKVWVDEQSFAVRRIEGDLAKSPSMWIRKVHVTLSFGDVNGSWLQTRLNAVADVRFIGAQTLTSQLVDFRIPEVVAQKTPTVARIPGAAAFRQH